MVLIDPVSLLALRRRRIAAVIEAVAVPRDTRDLDPFERIGQRLLRRQLHYLVFLPVGSGLRDAVDGVLRVGGWREHAEARRRRPFELVGIEQDLGRAV